MTTLATTTVVIKITLQLSIEILELFSDVSELQF